jgi:hypothetical protein
MGILTVSIDLDSHNGPRQSLYSLCRTLTVSMGAWQPSLITLITLAVSMGAWQPSLITLITLAVSMKASYHPINAANPKKPCYRSNP